MKIEFVNIFLLLLLCSAANGQFALRGKTLDASDQKPVEYASVVISDDGLWTTTDSKGVFTINNIPVGKTEVTVSCLGYVKAVFTVDIRQDTTVEWLLAEENLKLEEVTVSARRRPDEAGTSYIIDRTGLEHIQMQNVSDALRLLPGGQSSRETHFASDARQTIALRSNSGESGNPTFGTAIEVDGVRLSNNGSYNFSYDRTSGQLYGVDTRNIASSNIESIEVVTGLPGVEHGDLTNGVVKVNTRKGKTPLELAVSFKPHSKLYALSRGFDMGEHAGVLNISLERAKSISDIASPYTSYSRNALSLQYSNTFNRGRQPLSIEAGVAGNLGGFDSKNDPDAFANTFVRRRANSLRGNLRLNWLVRRAWLTNIEASASAALSDNLYTEQTNKSSSASVAALHGRDEGYFVGERYADNPDAAIVLIPAGYWHQVQYIDSKPVTYNARLKARWVHSMGAVRNHVLLGAEFTASGDNGRGEYYDDNAANGHYVPTWREYRYDAVPLMKNLAPFVEDKAEIKLGKRSSLEVVAGLRSDITMVRNSVYGTVSSLSPRFNAKYIFKNGRGQSFESMTVRAGWGKAVKLPSFAALYPQPAYFDQQTFQPGTMADGTSYMANYIKPYTTVYNPNLRWQYSHQAEIGAEARIAGVALSLTFFQNKLFDNYLETNVYEPFKYKLTDQSALENSAIAPSDRRYTVDRTSGVVTVHDLSGTQPAETLQYIERTRLKSGSTYINGSPVVRRGIEWTVNFGRIRSLRTSALIDGSYYKYRSAEKSLTPYSPANQTVASGAWYPYIGFYTGSNNASNGTESRKLNVNLTLTTHIPAVRLIVTLRIESTLINYTQRLSEADNAFVIADKSDYFPTADRPDDIYNRDAFVAKYPLYYSTMNAPEVMIPFAEKFAWARDNDRNLYNQLATLVTKTNSDYYFNANRISGYYSANLGVTKEIGDFASITFNAVNFTNNMAMVKNSDTGLSESLYQSRYIPKFYYGLTVKLKIVNSE